MQFRFAYGLARSAIEGRMCLPRLFPGLGVGRVSPFAKKALLGGKTASRFRFSWTTHDPGAAFARFRRRRENIGAASDAHFRISSNMLALARHVITRTEAAKS